jgi:hypothetical protein
MAGRECCGLVRARCASRRTRRVLAGRALGLETEMLRCAGKFVTAQLFGEDDGDAVH